MIFSELKNADPFMQADITGLTVGFSDISAFLMRNKELKDKSGREGLLVIQPLVN
jgi:hypothetical protein